MLPIRQTGEIQVRLLVHLQLIRLHTEPWIPLSTAIATQVAVALARLPMEPVIRLLTVLVFRLVHAAAIAVAVQPVIARALASALAVLKPPDARECRYSALVAHPAPLPAPGRWVDCRIKTSECCKRGL